MLALAARSPLFNAAIASPALATQLAPQYEAVDAQYGAVTDPSSIQTALHQFTPDTTTVATLPWRAHGSVSQPADGIRMAVAAQRAISALGATGELLPARQDLDQSYASAEAAWRYEAQVETAMRLPGGAQASASISPAVQDLMNKSTASIQQASTLHDQAIAVIQQIDPDAGTLANTSRANMP